MGVPTSQWRVRVQSTYLATLCRGEHPEVSRSRRIPTCPQAHAARAVTTSRKCGGRLHAKPSLRKLGLGIIRRRLEASIKMSAADEAEPNKSAVMGPDCVVRAGKCERSLRPCHVHSILHSTNTADEVIPLDLRSNTK